MKSEFRHVFLPYCLEQQPDGRWIVLNRNYKPLGVFGSEWVKYEDHPSLTPIALAPEVMAALCAPGSRCTDKRLFLYNDRCTPTDSAAHWAGYQARLEVLARASLGG